MTVQRRDKTTIDYIVIALNPALIVAMIASLVYFLTLCMYRGDFLARINYILFLFIVAAVGIARIAIEEGRSRATVFALALSAATLLSVMRFVGEGVLMVVALLALIWYLADRITIDCTMIDEHLDASGTGLLQGGLFSAIAAPTTDVALDGTTDRHSPGAPKASGKSKSQIADDHVSSDGSKAAQPRRTKRTHRPGIWILYLALAAIPLYGLGQILLPGDGRSRDSALNSLAIYLGSSLLLLVTTSFLGMRRYLRQRGVDMPAGISVRWLSFGAILVAGLLLLCFVLPLPGQLLASFQLPTSVTSPEGLQSNQQGWGDEGTEEGEGTGNASGDKPSGESGGKESGGKESGGKESGGKESGGKESGGKESGGKESGGKESGGKESGGKESGGKESGGKESGGKESGGKESGGKESGGKESGGKESGGKESGGKESGGKESGGKESGGEKSGGEESGGEESGGEESGGEESGGEESGGEESGGEESGGEQQSEGGESQPQEPSSVSEPPPPPPSSSWQLSDLLSKLSGILRFLIFAVLVGIVVFYAMRHRDEIVRWLQELFGGSGDSDQQASPQSVEKVAPPVRLRPFSEYQNPLQDASVSIEQAVVISFNALSAWAREQNCARGEQLTPSEFTQQLAQRYPEQSRTITLTAEMYNVVVYGNRNVNPAHRQTLQKLWTFMQQPIAAPPVATADGAGSIAAPPVVKS